MHHELIANPSLGEDIDTIIGNASSIIHQPDTRDINWDLAKAYAMLFWHFGSLVHAALLWGRTEALSARERFWMISVRNLDTSVSSRTRYRCSDKYLLIP
jgi:hypothetical protein